MATVEKNIGGNESSTNSFQWDGDEDRVDFNPNGSVSLYPLSCSLHPTIRPLRHSAPSPIPSGSFCSQVSLELSFPGASYDGSIHYSSLLAVDSLLNDTVLSPGLMSALLKAISPRSP